MKRIALFISSFQKGGSERVMAGLAVYFHEQKYDVILVTQYKKETEYNLPPEIRRVYSEPDESLLTGGRIKNFWVRYKALRDIWKAYKPDVILSFLGKNNLMAILTAAILPPKVVVSVRGEPSMEYKGKLMQMLARITFRFARGVVLQTARQAEFFPKAVQKKSVILHNPLNAQFLIRKDGEKKQDFIASVGYLDDNKNHTMLLHAFGKIADEYPTMQLVIYGEGEMRPKLEALIREKKLEDRVQLPGRVDNVAEKLCRARIFALTSNTEGMPNALMEAMALGLPVVSTDCPCGGPAELIQNGVNGILIPVGDAYALADAFRKILGENAQQSAWRLAPDCVYREWEDYLNRL